MLISKHLWITRRFEVLRRLAGDLIAQATAIAEIGCGHGLLQRQIEDFYQVEVAGFDLNETALKQTACRFSPVCCYDVREQSPEYEARFDLILLADVLEHIADQDAFLRAVKFHLAPGGGVLVNVPALQSLYSGYDRAVGHLRRYRIGSLEALARRHELTLARYTYWGFPSATAASLTKTVDAGSIRRRARSPRVSKLAGRCGIARCYGCRAVSHSRNS